MCDLGKGNIHCATQPGKYCTDSPSLGQCVQCTGDSHCSGSTRFCGERSCRQCTKADHCASNQYCLGYKCVARKAYQAACSSDSSDDECLTTRCLDRKCACEPKVSGRGCPAGKSKCGGSAERYCYQCTSDSHCSGSTRFCGANSCRQCTKASHCASNQYCTNYKCVARKAYQASCSSGDQCLTTRCLSGKCACEPKVSGRGCPAGKSKCGGSAERYCYQCTSDSHCSGSTRYCNNNVCISCKEDHHCNTNQYCSKTGCKSSASRMFRRHCSSSSQCASSRCRSGYMGGPNDPSKRQKICVCNPGRGGCPDGAYRCGGNDETVCIGHRPID